MDPNSVEVAIPRGDGLVKVKDTKLDFPGPRSVDVLGAARGGSVRSVQRIGGGISSEMMALQPTVR